MNWWSDCYEILTGTPRKFVHSKNITLIFLLVSGKQKGTMDQNHESVRSSTSFAWSCTLWLLWLWSVSRSNLYLQNNILHHEGFHTKWHLQYCFENILHHIASYLAWNNWRHVHRALGRAGLLLNYNTSY